eukprot:Blabericola_migrator_1__7025@NODE_355_length_9465_cov_113_241434_g284_i0_p7_GENE_NODE_355_length_9465_cov_113_241434_g284_i0NODE_355_length_9465_cov_113_241434_g284_i0_p7_ORF_typecomplete_len104_score35_91_NODE_355_length_9465_cov_113_241434_g284_i052175528
MPSHATAHHTQKFRMKAFIALTFLLATVFGKGGNASQRQLAAEGTLTFGDEGYLPDESGYERRLSAVEKLHEEGDYNKRMLQQQNPEGGDFADQLQEAPNFDE